MSDEAPARIDRMTSRNPQALELARYLSFAVLIEPALLRAIRLELLPSVDTGAEADLWFGPLVQSRSRDGIVLYPDVAELLRKGLPEQQAERSWHIMGRLHQYLPPAVKLEERLNWLSTRPGDNDGEIREQLQSALKALLVEKRNGVANWAGRALSRLPSAIRSMEEVTMLSAASDLRLGRTWTVSDHLQGKIPDWFASVLPDGFEQVDLGITITSSGLVFDPVPTAAQSMRIRVPATDPRIVQISSADESQIVSIDAKIPLSVRLSFGGRPVEITTLAGEAYTLQPAPARGPTSSPEQLACRAYANCNQALIVWQLTRPIKSCLGFALQRTDVEGDPISLPNFVGFSSSSESAPQLSSVWPIQRFAWADLSPRKGGHFFYTVTPMVGSPGKLTPLNDMAQRTEAIHVAAHEASPVAGYYNREAGNEERRGNPIPGGSASRPRPQTAIRVKLLELLAEARTSNQEIYAAIWILDDPELIEAIARIGRQAHILLAPGAVPNDSNAAARSLLADRVDLIARRVGWQAHSSFMVVCESGRRPTSVWTGSTTWHTGGLDAQDSNALLIQSPDIARNYLNHWHRLRTDPTISTMRQMNATPTSYTLKDGSQAIIRFAPVSNGADLDDVRERLSKARSGVLFAIGPRSRRSIVDDILELPKSLYVAGVARTFDAGQDVLVCRDGTSRTASLAGTGNRRDPATSQPPIGSRLIVIDPFAARPVVIAGSHFLSARASQSNEEDLVIIEGNTDLAIQSAVHIKGLIDHYAFRAVARGLKRPAKATATVWLSESDAWQQRFMSGEARREIEFWMGRRRFDGTFVANPEPPVTPSPAPSADAGGKQPSKKKASRKPPKSSGKSHTAKRAKKSTKTSAKRPAKRATSSVKKTAKKRKVAKKRKK